MVDQAAVDQLFESLIEKLSKSGVKYDFDNLRRAYKYASLAHEGQKRDTGEPYIIHPVNVAIVLSDFEPDTDALIASLLHDVIEDTPTTYRDMKKDFGAEVADLVEGVTKLEKIPYSSREEQQVENLRRMFLAMAKDIRVILIKLCDRLHNMRTMEGLSDEKRRIKALETMEVYAPLAHRLGIQKIKLELEDISLEILDPVAYHQIKEFLATKHPTGDKLLSDIKSKMENRLKELNIEYHIETRFKHIYSIYRKMYNHNLEIDQIYDLFAIRIIVNNLADCYTVLGIVHDSFTPLPGRFKDYISTPKPNMYQSLHTTVFSPFKVPFEVQIRTWDMHRTAEYGIAAHWKYKRGIFGKDAQDEKLMWVRKMLEIQKDVNDPEDFMRTLKIDMFADEVFVFTPQGDVINLPAGSTPIDFAFAIHSAVGNKMVGAKVNGHIVEFSYNLQNGQICEILTTSAPHGPNRDWIKIARTSEARNKIRQWFKKEKREENIENGKAEFETELRRNAIKFSDEQRIEVLAAVLAKNGMKNMDEFYASIGYGGISISKIIPRLKEEYQKIIASKSEAGDTWEIDSKNLRQNTVKSGVTVEGLNNCLVKFAKCCSPVPGDNVVGFITRGAGVSVHKSDCRNIKSLDDSNTGRLISVHWNSSQNDAFTANINIIASNRIALAADITSALASMRVMIHSLNARETKDGNASITVLIDVRNSEHLDSVLSKLKQIKDTISVNRIIQ